MKERPIRFSGSMVRALLDGSKTQTRRVVKFPHANPLGQWEPTTIGGENGGRTAAGETLPLQGGIWHTRTGDSLMCPHGQPGDQLWVRETWQHSNHPLGPYEPDSEVFYRADYLDDPLGPDLERSADGIRRRWRQNIHMPRTASRITLEVTSVRVERLQDISEDDSNAEGVHAGSWEYDNGEGTETARESFQCLWDSLAAPGTDWNANPWVWVIEFKRIGV